MAAAKFLVVTTLLAVAEGHRHTNISGYLHSSVKFETSSGKSIEVTWTHINPPNETRVAKYQNGTITDRLDDRYKLSHDGRHLVIEHLTEKDSGLYIAEFTLPNGTLVKETFNLTVLGKPKDEKPKKNDIDKDDGYLAIVIFGITLLAIYVAPKLWERWKKFRSTNRPDGQNDGAKRENLQPSVQDTDDQNGAETENLTAPVQDTETQESIFIEIPRKKIDVKPEEEEEEEKGMSTSHPP
ncbi:uncharacterized protein RB166_014917 [Leptodactylus fuscus]|uniref:uncharacterized protein LOC142214598 n=1 Tax=Leptodactylus fuscus TaxID=238119 RepID=UPI003F4EE0DC